MFYCKSAVGKVGHTITVTRLTGTTFPAVAVGFFSGSELTAPLETSNTSAGGAGICNSGSVTTAVDHDLIVSMISKDGAQTLSIDNGLTIAQQRGLVSAKAYAIGLAYLLDKTPAGAINPQWSWIDASNLSAGAQMALKKGT
jgi:hypothetical protein